MADNEKQFSETEHLAILADRVATETADLTAERDQLSTRVAELETQLDVAKSAQAAAEKAAEDAKAEFEQYKADQEAAREAAAKQGERIEKLREAASHLDEKFFTDPERAARIGSMSDEGFSSYLADIAAVAPSAASKGAPRETAMLGVPAGGADKTDITRSVLMHGRSLTKEA